MRLKSPRPSAWTAISRASIFASLPSATDRTRFPRLASTASPRDSLRSRESSTYFDAIRISDRVAFKAIEPADAPFLHPGRSAIVSLDGAPIGLIGELHPAEAMRLDLNEACAVCELDLSGFIS